MSHQLHSFVLWTKQFLRLYQFFMQLSCGWVSRGPASQQCSLIENYGCFFLLCQTQSGASTLRVSPQGNKQLRQTGSGRLWGRFSLRTIPTLWNVSHVVFVWYAARLCLVPSGIIYIYIKKKLPTATRNITNTKWSQRRTRACVCCQHRKKCTPAVITHSHTHTHKGEAGERAAFFLKQRPFVWQCGYMLWYVLPLVATS